MVAWYLNISLWHAFVMDASLVGFYLFYTFSYNWAYDKLFPITHFGQTRCLRRRKLALLVSIAT
ncbi:chlorhexidine efflux transporter [Psychrobacter celer]|uniref:chlorhexidine efflux transporter n=1 Tax=Psychrobacter TaxID=497 RepID=UPI00222861EB|nr:chlorhexidine efflux transporter [Psychrobacter sp. Marseille-P5312]